MQKFLPLTGNVHWLYRHGEVMYIDARVSSLRSGDIICPYDVNMVVVGCTAHNHHISLPGRQSRHMLSSQQESCNCPEATLLIFQAKGTLTYAR